MYFKTNVVNAVASAVTAAHLVMASSGLAFAQSTDEGGTAAGNASSWSVNCASGADLESLRCLMSQEIRVRQTGQRLIRAQVNLSGQAGVPFLTLSLPHGILFSEGVVVKVDDKAEQLFPINSADEQGSYVLQELGPETVDLFRQGSIAAITLTTLDGQKLQIELSLAGFSKAYGLVQAASAI
jgi:invasion protein IalB